MRAQPFKIKKTLIRRTYLYIYRYLLLLFMVFLVFRVFIVLFGLSGFLEFLWFSMFLLFCVFSGFCKKNLYVYGLFSG